MAYFEALDHGNHKIEGRTIVAEENKSGYSECYGNNGM
jgi:hypothetical protein